MNIVVCIKQVPDTTEVRLDPQTGALIRDGVPSIINPDDRSGLEAALQLREESGGTVTVLTMGPMQAEEALREALAMGADRAILLTDRAFAGADTWATSLTLAGALKQLPYDLIIAGRQAIDGDTAQVGPQMAEHLGLPHVSYVGFIRPETGALRVHRMFEDGHQVIRIKLPCLITVLKELNDPRPLTPRGIFDAYRERTIEVWHADQLDLAGEELGLKGSPTRVKGSYTKAPKGIGKVFELEPREAAKLVVEKLQEKFIV